MSDSAHRPSMMASGGKNARHAGKLFGGAGAGMDGGNTISITLNSPDNDAYDPRPNEAKDDVLVALEEKLGREEAHELQELFKLVDKDGGGSISQDEFMELLHTMSVRPSPNEMDLMYDELDADGDGVIEYTSGKEENIIEFLKFMCEPGVQSANGASLLKAFQYLEGYAYDLGLHHPAASGKSGHAGMLHVGDFAAALKTYLPDKVKSDKEAQDMMKHIRDTKGMFDYKQFVRSNVKPETLPPMDENGNYIFTHARPARRKTGTLNATEALQQAAEATKQEQQSSATPRTTGSRTVSRTGTPSLTAVAAPQAQPEPLPSSRLTLDASELVSVLDSTSNVADATDLVDESAALAAALAAASIRDSDRVPTLPVDVDGSVVGATTGSAQRVSVRQGSASGTDGVTDVPVTDDPADATAAASRPSSQPGSKPKSAPKGKSSKPGSKAASRTTTPAAGKRVGK